MRLNLIKKYLYVLTVRVSSLIFKILSIVPNVRIAYSVLHALICKDKSWHVQLYNVKAHTLITENLKPMIALYQLFLKLRSGVNWLIKDVHQYFHMTSLQNMKEYVGSAITVVITMWCIHSWWTTMLMNVLNMLWLVQNVEKQENVTLW